MRTFMKPSFVFLAALVLVGCALTTQPVYMTNPKNGGVVQCGPYDKRGDNAIAAAMHETQCIQDWKEQGYIRSSGRLHGR